MTRKVHFCLSVLFSLALAGLGMGTGQAGPMPGHTEMVICSDDGAETVTLDAAGNLVDPAECPGHGCPDCLQPVAATLPPGLVQLKPAAARRETYLAQPAHPFARSVATATARGPPSEV